MKRIYSCLLLCLFLMLCYVPLGRAQNTVGVDLGLGFGTDRDSVIPPSSPFGGIDSELFSSCSPNFSGDPFCVPVNGLGNLFMGIQGDVMLAGHFGVGGEVDFQPVHQDYGPLQERQSFYDFDGIWSPFGSKRYSLRLLGGIGGAHTGLVFPVCSTIASTICGNETEPFSTENHFQIHTGVALQVMVTEHIFVKPEVDYRYVPNLNEQFNSNSVPGFMVWVGYSFGGG